MIKLLVDTVGDKFHLALEKNGVISEAIFKDEQMLYYISERINKFFINNSIDIADINDIIINIGPGRFTSIRIGITYFKTLAIVNNIRIIPITLFDTLASTFLRKYKNDYSIQNIDKTKDFLFLTSTFGNNFFSASISFNSLFLEKEPIFFNYRFIKKQDLKELIFYKNYTIIHSDSASFINFFLNNNGFSSKREYIGIKEIKIESTIQDSFIAASRKKIVDPFTIVPLYIREHYAKSNSS